MTWTPFTEGDVSSATVSPFTLQAFEAGDEFSFEILANSGDAKETVIIFESDATFEDIEDAQEAAIGKLYEILTEVRGWINHHLEKRWKEETGRAHVGAG